MLETMVRKEVIFYVMAILMLFGVFAKVLFNLAVRKMVKAAGQIQKSNHKLMRLVKAKFEHASMVSDKVQNVEAFVDKYIYEYKICGIRLDSWRSLTKKILFFLVIIGTFTIFESYRLEGVGELMYSYLRWTFIFTTFLLASYFVGEEKMQIEATKNYMVEYLENVCAHRYAKANEAAEAQPEEMPEEKECAEPVDKPEEEEKKREGEREMRIRAILEEFLA